MSRRMYRYLVPVDDEPHAFGVTGSPVAVATTEADVAMVEFWAEYDDDAEPRDRTFQVFGTAHVLPPGAVWAGTSPRARGFVWHLYELDALQSGPSAPAGQEAP